MTERDAGRLADELEREADALARENERLADHVQEARQDWERKRNDPNVPGTPPPDRGDSEGTGEPETDFPAKTPSRDDDD